ncbi:MAG: hypothetical protein NC517_10780, partial [Firmicutes bacterium]|nr:hypothetical protein [Bacillota bacterium]
GNHKNIPDEISLSKEFFGGSDIAIDVKVKVICESESDSIINQYIIFSKVYDEQRKKYGRTKKAITETIRICKDRNVLREYLEEREKEVVSIMMSLYDEEEVMRSYIKSERYDETKDNARRLLRLGKIKANEISECFPDLSENDVRELETEVMQLA